MKIKFGAIVVAGSGKIGGHVASKNRGGAYLRTKVTPTNPNTSAQAGARALLSSLSTAWSGLTESQRLGWNGAVKDFATTDIFGDIKNPSGINLYVKLNANLIGTGQAGISDAPAKLEIPFSPLVSAVYDVSTPASTGFEFADAAMTDVAILVSATPKVSNGTSFVKNLYRNIGTVNGDEGLLTFGDDYIAKFGNLTVGDKIFLKVEAVLANGQKGTAQTISIVAVA
jgi:hypothetical protein